MTDDLQTLKKNKNGFNNISVLCAYNRTSTNKRGRGDQRRDSDRDHVNWSERQHSDDSQGVRQLRQTHHRTVPAQSVGPVLARRLSQVRLLRLSSGWSRVHVVYQSQPDTLQKRLSQVKYNSCRIYIDGIYILSERNKMEGACDPNARGMVKLHLFWSNCTWVQKKAFRLQKYSHTF